MPANLNKKKYNKVLNIAKQAHKALGWQGVTRSDFKFYRSVLSFRNKHSAWYDKSFFSP